MDGRVKPGHDVEECSADRANHSVVMPALEAGIHAVLPYKLAFKKPSVRLQASAASFLMKFCPVGLAKAWSASYQ